MIPTRLVLRRIIPFTLFVCLISGLNEILAIGWC